MLYHHSPQPLINSLLLASNRALVRRCLSFILVAFPSFWVIQGIAQPAGNLVAAYGHVSPGERAVTVSASAYLGSPPIVSDLLVREGDNVTRHQKLAITQNRAVASADLAIARSRLALAEKRLDALTAGPKNEELATQEALIKNLDAEAKAEKAKKRPDSDAGRREADARQEATAAKVTMGQHQLEAMREVGPSDLAVAKAEVEEAKAAVTRAETLLTFTSVEAPFDGQVLKILAYPGEEANRGLLELGVTRAMVIKAELNVADAQRVKPGDAALIKSEAWQGEIKGTVTRINPSAERSALTALSTFANVDRQVIGATITPTTPEGLAGLTGVEVTVTIATASK